jgi:hypothetical protein
MKHLQKPFVARLPVIFALGSAMAAEGGTLTSAVETRARSGTCPAPFRSRARDHTGSARDAVAALGARF